MKEWWDVSVGRGVKGVEEMYRVEDMVVIWSGGG